MQNTGLFQNEAAVRALNDEKVHTMHLMVEQEQRNVDQLRLDLVHGGSTGFGGSTVLGGSTAAASSNRRQRELEAAVRRLERLQQQLNLLTGVVVRL